MMLSPPPENHTHDHIFVLEDTQDDSLQVLTPNKTHTHVHTLTHSSVTHLKPANHMHNPDCNWAEMGATCTSTSAQQSPYCASTAYSISAILLMTVNYKNITRFLRCIQFFYQTSKMAERKAATGFYLNVNKTL